MRRDRRKDLYRTQRGSLEGPHEQAEIQRKALRRGKNLAFSEDTCLEKKRVRSKVTPRKVGVGLKRRREPSRRRLGWRLAWWGSTEKNEASHFLGLRGRHQYSDQRSNRNRRRASRLPCLSIGLGDNRRSTLEWRCKPDDLDHFCERQRKPCVFHFIGLPGFRMAFNAAERSGSIGHIQCQRCEESSSRGKRKRRIFLCRRTVGDKVRRKVIPVSFLKIEGRGTLVGVKDQRERD